MKIYCGWYNRDTKALFHVEKDTYESITHIRSCAALMAAEYVKGEFGDDLTDVFAVWSIRGTDDYLGVFALSGDPVEQADLDLIEAQAQKYKKRWA
jgi:hypothetical protein